MCDFNPNLLFSFQEEVSLQHFNIHTIVERTTQVITEAIKLAYKKVQHSNRKSGNQICESCTSASSRRHRTTTFQVQQIHQSHCILRKIHKELQIFQSQQANSHSDHTKSEPGSDLLCEDGTTDFIRQEVKDLKGQGEAATTSSLKTLHPFIDQDGILRVG
jgi:hypothetical protein